VCCDSLRCRHRCLPACLAQNSIRDKFLSKPISELDLSNCEVRRWLPGWLAGWPAASGGCPSAWRRHCRHHRLTRLPSSPPFAPAQRITTSYVRLPAGYPKLICSGRSQLGSVLPTLNDTWVSSAGRLHPSSSSSSSSAVGGAARAVRAAAGILPMQRAAPSTRRPLTARPAPRPALPRRRFR
jgi:hypothetical protein